MLIYMLSIFRSLPKSPAAFWPDTRLSGILLFSMWGLVLIHTYGLINTSYAATVLAWVFVLIELPRLKAKQRKQILILAGIGMAGAIWAWTQGSQVTLISLLEEHLKLAMLLTAVNFIVLATRLERSDRLRGFRSFSLTLGGMHLLASIANFSSVILVGDQVQRKDRIDLLSQMILSRGFGLAVLWSPFLSILPLVLEQVPAAEIHEIYPYSISLAVLGLILTLIEARFRCTSSLTQYDGYPLKSSTLRLPALLISGVLIIAWIYPDLPTITVVSSLAVLVPLIVISLQNGLRSGGKKLIGHVTGKLADARAEISLFLSAGLLAGGVKACIGVGLITLPVSGTDATVAAAVMWAIVVLAILGIHQLALVAIFAGLLADVTTTPTLMAVSYVLATALSMSGSTFSGLSFILQARFHSSAREILQANLPYTGMMLLAGTAALYLMESLGVR